jgi:tetratricopeptide (TPR) repeat protein
MLIRNWVSKGLVFAVGLSVSFPLFGQVDPRAEAYYLYCLGRKYEMEGANEQSLANYTKALEKDPGAAYLHLALAELHVKSNRVDEAIESAREALTLDPELADAHRLLGNIYFSLGRTEQNTSYLSDAMKELEETVRLEGWDVESRQRLADLYIVHGEIGKAAAQLESLIKQAPESYYGMYRLAQIHYEQGSLEEAAKYYRRAVEVEPRHQASRLELGRVLTEMGEFDQAASVYRGALELAPKDARVRVRLAYALAYGGQLEPAASEFERVLADDDENIDALLGLALVRQDLRELDVSENLLKQILEKKPDLIRARRALAELYRAKRDFESATRELQALLDMPVGTYLMDQEAETLQRAEFLTELGYVRQELEDHQGAVEAFEKAREYAPDDPRFEAELVQALLEADELDQASYVCERAIARFPKSMQLRVLDALVVFEQGRKAEALDTLQSLAKADPSNLMLVGSVVNLYQRDRRHAEAEEFVLDMIERTSETQGLLFQLGATLERQKKFDEAEEAFKKILESSPDHAPTLNYLGYMLADRGVRLEESLDYLKRAVALDPYNGAYLDSLGWVYYKLDKLDLAEENLTKAIKYLRLTGVVYDHLGDIYYKKGKREEALRSWRKAIEQDDEDLEKDEVRRKIERALDER